MLHGSRIFGAVLAGGIGSRMKSATIPKQFLLINDVPIIIITLKKMLGMDEFDFIYIAMHKDWTEYWDKIRQKYNISDQRVVTVLGGDDRFGSVENILCAIEDEHGIVLPTLNLPFFRQAYKVYQGLAF
jgi:2-C-methyl-D-erythritol 4-phosphate cytidylyltransferase